MIRWRDSYSCNIKEIDNQHKRLFELAGQLFTIASLKDEYDHYDEIMRVLDELKDYTVYHFGYEERLLEMHNYPETKQHKWEHVAFINKINSLSTEDLDISQEKVVLDIVIFMADWIEKHILKSDHKYKDILNAQGVC